MTDEILESIAGCIGYGAVSFILQTGAGTG